MGHTARAGWMGKANTDPSTPVAAATSGQDDSIGRVGVCTRLRRVHEHSMGWDFGGTVETVP